MQEYEITDVDVTGLTQKITLRGVSANADAQKQANVSRWRPILKRGGKFIVYNYRSDEKAMLAQEYTANGKIYIDVPTGWSDREQRILHDMMGVNDAAIFRRHVVDALRVRRIPVSGNAYEDLKKLMESQNAECAIYDRCR